MSESHHYREQLSPVEIGFGYEFINIKGRSMVITDPGIKGPNFQANFVYMTDSIESLNVQGGTLYIEDIKEMTGVIWDLQRIERAVRVYMRNANNASPDELISFYRQYSSLQPRRLPL